MQKNSKLLILDCSLRDGGYYTNWDFPDSFVKEYLKRMNGLPVDYIEIGYRSTPKPGYLGAYYYSPPHILDLLIENSDKKLAVMLNSKDIIGLNLENLMAPCIGKISMVRIAVATENLVEMPEIVSKLKRMKFEVALNLMYLSKWWREPTFISDLQLFSSNLDFLYLVDSYGGMLPSDVQQIFKLFGEETDLELGFHAHNNLELALANSQMAIDHGAQIVDCTLTGMGRGAGNLKTELLLTVLNKNRSLDLDFDELSKAVSLFIPLKDQYQWGTNLAYMVSGANSLPQQEVMGQISKRFYSLNSIVRGVDNRSKGIMDNLQLREFYSKDKFSSALIIGGGPSSSDHAPGILLFLKENKDICVIHASSRNVVTYRELQGIQYHCLVGNEGHRLENSYSNLESGEKIAVLPPFPRTMGTYIPPALEDSAFQLKGGVYMSRFPESVTALAVETAKELGVKTFYFVGYDGYTQQIKPSELELFQENEMIFEMMETSGEQFSALTPTKYTRLHQESVYSYL